MNEKKEKKQKVKKIRLLTKKFKVPCPDCNNYKRFVNMAKTPTYRSKCTKCKRTW